MKNTDIFKFKFVDRDSESKKLESFLNFSNHYDSALWINGNRGCGKTYFLENRIIEPFSSKIPVIYMDLHDFSTSKSYINHFLQKLNEIADLKFREFIKANYKSIIDISQKVTEIALSTSNINDLGINGIGFSIVRDFISSKNETHSLVKVISRYIEIIIKKRKQLIIILDNFTKSDLESADLMSQIIFTFLKNSSVRFIICTTNEDLLTRNDIKAILSEKIPVENINIDPFNNDMFFLEILDRVFDIGQSEKEDIKHLFEICNGYPQRLKEFLVNLFFQQGISLGTSKAQFCADKFKQLLVKELISFDINALDINKKKLLEIISLWGMPIPFELLLEFIAFLYSEDQFSTITKQLTISAVEEFEEISVIIRKYDFGEIIVKFKHDSLYYAINEYCKMNRAASFVKYNIYNFLKYKKASLSSDYLKVTFPYLEALHSYNSNAQGWEQINYDYGLSLHNQGLFYEAKVVFDRLSNFLPKLNESMRLTIAENNFECGENRKAEGILETIEHSNIDQNLNMSDKLKFYLLYGNVKSVLLCPNDALRYLGKAQQNLDASSEEYISVMNLKQSVLFLSPGGYPKAKQIFDQLVKADMEKNIFPLRMASVYQTAMDYYQGDISLNFLKKGLMVAKNNNQQELAAKLQHNIGFEETRCKKYEEAMDCFKQSLSVFKNFKMHYQSYQLNNIAVIHMIRREWNEAIQSIFEGIFWNKSDYAKVVLKTNLMLCYYFNSDNRWKIIWEELDSYLYCNPEVDDKIYKKILINMALIKIKSNEMSEGKKFLERCLPHIKNEGENGKRRFQELFNLIVPSTYELQYIPKPFNDYYKNIEFEPWLVTFSHD